MIIAYYNDMPKQQVKWIGTVPTACQLCHRDLKHEFIDGRLRFCTAWAIVCSSCHNTHGYGLGVGKGQKYDLKTLNKIE